jgi:hypothetical protein
MNVCEIAARCTELQTRSDRNVGPSLFSLCQIYAPFSGVLLFLLLLSLHCRESHSFCLKEVLSDVNKVKEKEGKRESRSSCGGVQPLWGFAGLLPTRSSSSVDLCILEEEEEEAEEEETELQQQQQQLQQQHHHRYHNSPNCVA